MSSQGAKTGAPCWPHIYFSPQPATLLQTLSNLLLFVYNPSIIHSAATIFHHEARHHPLGRSPGCHRRSGRRPVHSPRRQVRASWRPLVSITPERHLSPSKANCAGTVPLACPSPITLRSRLRFVKRSALRTKITGNYHPNSLSDLHPF